LKGRSDAGSIHLWFGDVREIGPEPPTEPAAGLTPFEHQRWSGLQLAEARSRYLRRHMALRTLLGGWLGVAADQVALSWLPSGKPLADHWQDGRRLAISLASREDQLLLAASWGGQLGVDFEPLRPIPDLNSLAQMALHPAEQRFLARRPTAQRARHFLRLWVRKEAVLKAAGVGLNWDPRQVNVLGSTLRRSGVHVRLAAAETANWFVQDLDLAADHLIAVSTDDQRRPVVVQRWPATAGAEAAPATGRRRLGNARSGLPG
jgi:4'-phosphopantetheinyl transferase